MGTEGTPRSVVTRRAVLVAGGVTLLAGYAGRPGPARIGTARAAATHSAHDLAAVKPGHSARSHAAAAGTVPPSGPPPTVPPQRDPGLRRDEPMYYVDDGRKVIALTIDDGPSPVYTPQVLRLLEQYRITASFSMIGLEVHSFPSVARDVSAAGHVIANHTWSHVDLALYTPAKVASQIDRATETIHRATGQVPRLFRAPYGAWSRAVFERCARSGMIPLDWSVDPRDWARPGVAAIVRNIMRNTTTGSIILEHDGGGNRAQTVAALKIVLPRLIDEGFRFTTP